jgi:hypothetical protein
MGEAPTPNHPGETCLCVKSRMFGPFQKRGCGTQNIKWMLSGLIVSPVARRSLCYCPMYKAICTTDRYRSGGPRPPSPRVTHSVSRHRQTRLARPVMAHGHAIPDTSSRFPLIPCCRRMLPPPRLWSQRLLESALAVGPASTSGSLGFSARMRPCPPVVACRCR